MSSTSEAAEAAVAAGRPSPSHPTIPEPTEMEQRWVEKAKKCILFECGAAVQMGPRDSTDNLQRRMLSLYKERVQLFNPFTCDKTRSVLGTPPRESVYRDIIRPLFLKTMSGKEVDGAYLYVAFKNLKSEIIVHWLPGFNVMRSGENLDDRLRRAHNRVWLVRETKKNNAYNARNKSRPGFKRRPDVQEKDMPKNHFEEHPFVEMPTFILYHSHRLFQQEESERSTTITEGSPAAVPSNRKEIRRLKKKRKAGPSRSSSKRSKKEEVSSLSSASSGGESRRERHMLKLESEHNAILQQQNQLELCKILMQVKDTHGDEFNRVIKSTVEAIAPTAKDPVPPIPPITLDVDTPSDDTSDISMDN
jgi:hypothetical protein